MVKTELGNILNCTEDIIVHQVNVQGVMGGGLARQLANQYPNLEKKYSRYCTDGNNDWEKLKGRVFKYYTPDRKIIMNIFSQRPNFDTDYEEMKNCLMFVKRSAKMNRRSVAIPYGIGCGIANGNWKVAHEIIKEVFKDYEVTLYKLENKGEINK